MRDIGPEDVVVFANGSSEQQPSRFNGNDIDEQYLVRKTYEQVEMAN